MPTNLREINIDKPVRPGFAKDFTEIEQEARFGGYKMYSMEEYEVKVKRNAEMGAPERILADDFPEQDEKESLA